MQRQTPENILKRLTAGNARFAAARSRGSNTTPKYRNNLLTGQKPMAVIVSCSDSRVAPEIIFDAQLGDLFVVRTAGNLVDSLAMESIEYGICHLGIQLIIVLGHSYCGAVTETVKLETVMPEHGIIANLLKPAVNDAINFSKDLIEGTILANISQTVTRLSRAPSLLRAATDNNLLIRGAIYRLEDGLIHHIYTPSTTHQKSNEDAGRNSQQA